MKRFSFTCPLSGGRVALIPIAYHDPEIPGLAIHRYISDIGADGTAILFDGWGDWVVTHIQSGMALAHDFPTRKDAGAYVQRVAGFFDYRKTATEIARDWETCRTLSDLRQEFPKTF
jgi:hypothetical protein